MSCAAKLPNDDFLNNLGEASELAGKVLESKRRTKTHIKNLV